MSPLLRHPSPRLRRRVRYCGTTEQTPRISTLLCRQCLQNTEALGHNIKCDHVKSKGTAPEMATPQVWLIVITLQTCLAATRIWGFSQFINQQFLLCVPTYAHANHWEEKYEQLSSECPPFNKDLIKFLALKPWNSSPEECGFQRVVNSSPGRIFQIAKQIL